MPDSLFKSADRLAKRLGISRSELFQRALLEFLQEHQEEQVTEALDKVYGPGYEESHLDLLLEQLQMASLPTDRW